MWQWRLPEAAACSIQNADPHATTYALLTLHLSKLPAQNKLMPYPDKVTEPSRRQPTIRTESTKPGGTTRSQSMVASQTLTVIEVEVGEGSTSNHFGHCTAADAQRYLFAFCSLYAGSISHNKEEQPECNHQCRHVITPHVAASADNPPCHMAKASP